jgi:hypothetical protein
VNAPETADISAGTLYQLLRSTLVKQFFCSGIWAFSESACFTVAYCFTIVCQCKAIRRNQAGKMNLKEIQKLEAYKQKVISGVLGQYVSRNGCPCSWPQFVFWAGKDQGPGWQDNVQNILVKSALTLTCFVKSPPKVPEYALEADVTCTICGAQWKYFSLEWRMLAFQESLVRTDREIADNSQFLGINSDDVFATAGFEPEEGTRVLSLDEWVQFMQIGTCSTQPYRRYFSHKPV